MEIRGLERRETDQFIEELFIPFATELAEHDSALALVSEDRYERASEYWKDSFEDEERQVLVAVNDSNLIGYAALRIKRLPPMFEFGPEMHITEFYVKTSHRRQGVGTALMAEIEQTATDHDCEALSLFVHTENESAKEFYELFDFAEDRYRLTKQL